MNFVFGYSIPAAFALIGAIVLFIKSRTGNKAQRSMAILLATMSIAAFMYAMYFDAPNANSIWFDLIYTATAPFCAPLFCMFVINLTSTRGITNKTWHLFIVPMVYAITVYVIEIFMTPEDNLAYVMNITHGAGYSAGTTKAYEVMTLVGYTIFGVGLPLEIALTLAWAENKLNKYKRLIDDYYASNEGKSVYASHIINICVLLMLPVAVFLTFVPINAEVPDKIVWTMIGLECLLILLIVIYAFRICYTAEDLLELMEEDGQHTGPLTTFESLKVKLKQLTDEGICLDPDISLVSLAKTLGTNRTYVQKAIAETYGVSFSDYVNSQRIRHSLELMQIMPRENIVLKQIATESGYASSSSFYRNFELFTGYSPTEWMNKNLK